MLRDTVQGDRLPAGGLPGRSVERPSADRGVGAAPVFRSILHPLASDAQQIECREAPAHFRDLNLDQVVSAVTAGYEAFDLAPFFHAPLHDLEAIAYRQEVARDLEREDVAQAVRTFTQRLGDVLRFRTLAAGLHFKQHREGWFLASVEAYCVAVEQLAQDLAGFPVASRGLRAFRAWLKAYVDAPSFRKLSGEARRLRAELSSIRYALVIQDSRVTVRHDTAGVDYSAAVEATFAKFRRGAVKDYRLKFTGSGINHVEAQVLERVAWLHPDTFRALDAFCTARADFLDKTIGRFYREVQVYVAYLGYVGFFRNSGLDVCYPQLVRDTKDVAVHDAFDPALARKLLREHRTVVRNGFHLQGGERILVVSGPNQGGKTTFARMFGQLHYLASLGLPVPARQARLFLSDRVLTHFDREEDLSALRSKLEDDLLRVREILEQSTPHSIVILNEIFSSTTVKDALFLARKVLQRLSQLDLLCVCVTFLDELASLNGKTVSMVSQVNPRDPALRTYRLERRPADGLTYALAIAEKHGVTYDRLKERIEP